MRRIFHTVMTSQRHRELGYCEDNDFGKLDLYYQTPPEKELIVSFKKYTTDPRKEYVKVGDRAFRKMHNRDFPKEFEGKQGKFSNDSAIKYMLYLREQKTSQFTMYGDYKYLLIGRTLYSDYCDIKELSISVCGNLLFSHWLSIDIESDYSNKRFEKLSKSNFKKILKEQRQRFEETKGGVNVDNHSSFSYPTKIKWGKEFTR